MNKLLMALLLNTVITGGVVAKTVTWEPPTQRADGKALAISEIAQFKIYYGPDTGSYTDSVTINDATLTTFNLDVPDNETQFAVMTTVDTGGRESKYSTEAILSATGGTQPPVQLKPLAPTNLMAEQMGTTLEYRFSFTPPTKYTDGSDLIGVITKYFLFDNGKWVRDIPADLLSFTLTLTSGDHLFDMETEIRTAGGGWIVSARSAMLAVIAAVAPNPPIMH